MNFLSRSTWNLICPQLQIDHRPILIHYTGKMLKRGNQDRLLTYILCSVLVHSGNVSSGHYFAFIKPTKDKTWYVYGVDPLLLYASRLTMNHGIG